MAYQTIISTTESQVIVLESSVVNKDLSNRAKVKHQKNKSRQLSKSTDKDTSHMHLISNALYVVKFNFHKFVPYQTFTSLYCMHVIVYMKVLQWFIVKVKQHV